MIQRNSDTRTLVGVVQTNSNDDVERNLDAVERTVGEAAARGAKLVVVPECFAFLGPEEGKLEIAETLPAVGAAFDDQDENTERPILSRCQRLARSHGIDLVLGGHWERTARPGFVRNASVHLKPDGAIAAVYRKIHLFDVDLPDGTRLTESATVEPGSEVVVTSTPAGRLGLTICYDVRFPELYRRLVDHGATMLAVPAAFTLATGKDHWHVLMRARAIEQQCYVLAAAQTGHHVYRDGSGDRRSYGHALIVDPWGTVVAECGEGEGVAVAQVDSAVIANTRKRLPSLQHRKL